MRKPATTFILTLMSALALAAAQTEITFWHSMGTAKEAVEELADRFNTSQSDWRVDAQHVGSYSEAQTRLAAAFGTPSAPVIFQAEVGYWPKLVQDGALHDLSSEVAELDPEFTGDFYPGLW
ncbi:MAG TPA: ABC transporter substrate-binding protein, partial [Deinococcales bacterium]|nr:ABC transporter substrate-binding protein [Deinococcales bacterium]